MKFERSAGIILHPTSLPSPDGIGDLGPEAFRWLDFLAESGCSLWQILPLGPTGYGDSPYQCFSAFAGNPFLISPALLMADGLLTRLDLADRPKFSDEEVQYGEVITWKLKLLDRAYANFQKLKPAALLKELEAFRQAQQFWLPDFTLFMAIKEANGGVSWDNWPEPLRSRDAQALHNFREKNAEALERHTLRQFLFFRQWNAVRQYAHEKGLQIIGDLPIFVAFDSADAWSHSDLFFLDKAGKPTVVAGVPPDYFSPTGQLWGNPLYRWNVHKKTAYAWWIERVKASLNVFDIIRFDHFRGFAGYWEVPYGMPTAEKGRWAPGPGADFFNALMKSMGDLPLIAEDLGEITPDVVALRDQFNLPGMKIFQFAFATDPDDPFLPHNYPNNCVAYTGTHDNDTARGYYDSASEEERDFIRRYLARSGSDISWDMIRAVWSSVAVFALAPLQDMLSLGNAARMNFPGKPSGNWGWRMSGGALDPQLAERIFETNHLYSRLSASGLEKVEREEEAKE